MKTSRESPPRLSMTQGRSEANLELSACHRYVFQIDAVLTQSRLKLPDIDLRMASRLSRPRRRRQSRRSPRTATCPSRLGIRRPLRT